jgi:ABC-type branched-subunit amino acid transport system permease subunit
MKNLLNKKNACWLVLIAGSYGLISLLISAGVINNVYLTVLMTIGINIILAISLNLIIGVTGQFSLGHAGFMIIGAYCAGVAVKQFSASLGGEEFLIIMTEQPEREAQAVLTGIAEKIRSYPFSYDGYQIRITMTFGLTSGVIGPDFESLVKLADQRMYQGKRQGKDQIVS